MKDGARRSNRFEQKRIDTERALNKRVEPMLQRAATRFEEQLNSFFGTEEGKTLQQRANRLVDDFDRNVVLAVGIPKPVLMSRLKTAYDIMEELGRITEDLVVTGDAHREYSIFRDAEMQGAPRSIQKYFSVVNSQIGLMYRNYLQKYLFTGPHAGLHYGDLHQRFEDAYTRVTGFPPRRSPD